MPSEATQRDTVYPSGSPYPSGAPDMGSPSPSPSPSCTPVAQPTGDCTEGSSVPDGCGGEYDCVTVACQEDPDTDGNQCDATTTTATTSTARSSLQLKVVPMLSGPGLVGVPLQTWRECIDACSAQLVKDKAQCDADLAKDNQWCIDNYNDPNEIDLCQYFAQETHNLCVTEAGAEYTACIGKCSPGVKKILGWIWKRIGG